jgi:hypothetical protein
VPFSLVLLSKSKREAISEAPSELLDFLKREGSVAWCMRAGFIGDFSEFVLFLAVWNGVAGFLGDCSEFVVFLGVWTGVAEILGEFSESRVFFEGFGEGSPGIPEIPEGEGF